MGEGNFGEYRKRRGAMPRVYSDPADRPPPSVLERFLLEVDGEEFEVAVFAQAVGGFADTSYTWLSGPNEGYGFNMSGPHDRSLGERREHIRGFLAMIDPSTGYIAEESRPTRETANRATRG
jgi:hypothetical protein